MRNFAVLRAVAPFGPRGTTERRVALPGVSAGYKVDHGRHSCVRYRVGREPGIGPARPPSTRHHGRRDGGRPVCSRRATAHSPGRPAKDRPRPSAFDAWSCVRPQTCRRPGLARPYPTTPPRSFTIRTCLPATSRIPNRRSTSVVTLRGGRTVRSIFPPCDTPGVAPANPRSCDTLPRADAEAAWRAVTPLIAGTPHVRISRDGGRTYPARHARPLPADPPAQPCTVPVYDPASGTGRMLVLDLDPARGDVDRQAAELVQLLEHHGARVLADVSPSGGRHLFVLFSAPLPWRELRDAARAFAQRHLTVDPAPMSSLGGQISPPGARHKSGGWRLLSMPLAAATAAAGHPNGPELPPAAI